MLYGRKYGFPRQYLSSIAISTDIPVSGEIHNTKPCRGKIAALFSAGSLLHAVLGHIAERFHGRHVSCYLFRFMHRPHRNNINDHKYCCRYDQCIQYTESAWFHKISCHAADDNADGNRS